MRFSTIFLRSFILISLMSEPLRISILSVRLSLLFLLSTIAPKIKVRSRAKTDWAISKSDAPSSAVNSNLSQFWQYFTTTKTPWKWRYIFYLTKNFTGESGVICVCDTIQVLLNFKGLPLLLKGLCREILKSYFWVFHDINVYILFELWCWLNCYIAGLIFKLKTKL